MFSQHSLLILCFSRAVKLNTFSIFRSLYVDKRNPFPHSCLMLDGDAGALMVSRGAEGHSPGQKRGLGFHFWWDVRKARKEEEGILNYESGSQETWGEDFILSLTQPLTLGKSTLSSVSLSGRRGMDKNQEFKDSGSSRGQWATQMRASVYIR